MCGQQTIEEDGKRTMARRKSDSDSEKRSYCKRRTWQPFVGKSCSPHAGGTTTGAAQQLSWLPVVQRIMVRFKNRYLLLEVHWADGMVDENLPHTALANALRDAISLTFGDFGSAAAGRSVDVKYWNSTTSLAIVRCTRSHYRMVWAGASFVTKIGQRHCAICARHVGGTQNCNPPFLMHNCRDHPLLPTRHPQL